MLVGDGAGWPEGTGDVPRSMPRSSFRSRRLRRRATPSQRGPLARQVDRLLPACDPAEPATRLPSRAHGARARELDARLVARRSASALGPPRAANGRLAVRPDAIRATRCSASACAANAAHSCCRTSSRRSVVPFLVSARRLGIPIVAHVASWDHTVGKGVIAPFCDVYIVQNATMRDDLIRYHEIDPSESWSPAGRRPTSMRAASARGLRRRRPVIRPRPGAPARRRHGEHADERAVRGSLRRASRSLVGGGGSRTHVASVQAASARPCVARSVSQLRSAIPGVHVQEASFTDLDVLATILEHASCVVANAGTILLEALVNDRPAVCVLYDEGAPPGESWAMKNVIGEHYRELAASGAFYRARAVRGRRLGASSARSPLLDELRDARSRVVAEIVGEVDGHAAERVTDAIVRGIRQRRGEVPLESDHERRPVLPLVLRVGVVVCIAIAAGTAGVEAAQCARNLRPAGRHERRLYVQSARPHAPRMVSRGRPGARDCALVDAGECGVSRGLRAGIRPDPHVRLHTHSPALVSAPPASDRVRVDPMGLLLRLRRLDAREAVRDSRGRRRRTDFRATAVVTVRALAGLFVFNATLIGVGWAMLFGSGAIRSWGDLVRLTGVAYFVALGSTMVLLTLELVIGLPVNALTGFLTLTGLAAAGLLVGVRRSSAARLDGRECPYRRYPSSSPSVWLASSCMARPFSEPRGFRAPWASGTAGGTGFRGRRRSTSSVGSIRSCCRSSPPPSYPPGLPAVHALAFHAMGSADDVTLHVQYWFYAVGFIAAVAGFLAPVYARRSSYRSCCSCSSRRASSHDSRGPMRISRSDT